MIISQEKAAIICNKVQYGEASNWEKLQLKLHLLLHRTSRTYTQKNTELTRLCHKANLKVLSESEKEQMKNALQKKE